ncbi:hypothetical protein ACSNOI_24295 [Actinomadura kijaniata]|uniref:hypothetical protein n=1 Tax=Actinomadura kijaniata TaxID=46161 RepID=UPI003F1AFACD
MHVLDDPVGLSERAQDLLRRTGRRRADAAFRVPTDFLWVFDEAGRSIPAPTELVIRREAFHARYGGLRYRVRRAALLGDQRHDVIREWDFDLGDRIRAERRGWSFSWIGERVSAPVGFLVHTDGRVGVSDGGAFIEVASSVVQLIEGHAVMDLVASWDPWPGRLEAWVPNTAWTSAADRIEGLVPVAEASGRCDTWLLSDHVAVRSFHVWTSRRPRRRAVQIWSCGNEGREQLEQAFRAV